MPTVEGLRVVRSPIHGYGVFATRAFAEGEKIADVDGVAWKAGDGVDDTYSLLVEDGLFFDMVDQTRWINHCCEPNAGVESGVTDGKVWARIVAERAIAEGEEITYDYAFPAHLAEPCRCGAAKCRGLIIEAA
jgi:histone-lysine N-methyltransferase SETD1